MTLKKAPSKSALFFYTADNEGALKVTGLLHMKMVVYKPGNVIIRASCFWHDRPKRNKPSAELATLAQKSLFKRLNLRRPCDFCIMIKGQEAEWTVPLEPIEAKVHLWDSFDFHGTELNEDFIAHIYKWVSKRKFSSAGRQAKIWMGLHSEVHPENS